MPESARLDAREWFALRRLHYPSERTRVCAGRIIVADRVARGKGVFPPRHDDVGADRIVADGQLHFRIGRQVRRCRRCVERQQ